MFQLANVFQEPGAGTKFQALEVDANVNALAWLLPLLDEMLSQCGGHRKTRLRCTSHGLDRPKPNAGQSFNEVESQKQTTTIIVA